MSVVCCKINETSIDIASDSIIVRGWTQNKSDNKFSKLFKVNELVIGAVGAAEEASLLHIFSKTHKPKASDEEGILEFLSEFLDWKKKKADSYKLENSYIIVFGGKAYHIHNFFINEILKYEAIGAGEEYALSALYLGHTVEKAVQTACELSIYCELPLVKFREPKHA